MTAHLDATRAGEAPIGYLLLNSTDPEERLEDAALWKAMRDEYGDEITPLDDRAEIPACAFGRGRMFAEPLPNPVPSYLPYWTDPAFLAAAKRSFVVCPFERVEEEVAKLHAIGKGAFIKSTRVKHAIFRVPVGTDPMVEIGDMAYSFMDGGPLLMVQELCSVEFEHRFFCIDRTIVTGSPVQVGLTPIDYPLPYGTLFRTPNTGERERRPRDFEYIERVATKLARKLATPHAVIDCALINGTPGVIELNPMRLGETGLFACDVRALAKASRKLLPSPESEHGEGRT